MFIITQPSAYVPRLLTGTYILNITCMLHHKHLLLCLWLNHVGEITSLYPYTWHSGTLSITLGQFWHLFTVIG